MLTCLVPVLFTFYIQDVPKLKNNSGAKGLITVIDLKLKKPFHPTAVYHKLTINITLIQLASFRVYFEDVAGTAFSI